EAYLGITTGRTTPALVKTIWSPSSRTQRKPSAANTFTSCLYETGLSFGMRHGQRQRDSQGANEPWPFQPAPALQITRLFQYLFEGAKLLGFLQKQPDRFLKILHRLFLGAAARGHVQFGGVRHEGSALFENLGCELNLHVSMVNQSGAEVQYQPARIAILE